LSEKAIAATIHGANEYFSGLGILIIQPQKICSFFQYDVGQGLAVAALQQ